VLWVMLNLISVCLEMMLVSVQDKCTVCAEDTIDLGSFWTYRVVLQGDKAQVEAHFHLFEDSANLDAI
jgi:hypothetical protein